MARERWVLIDGSAVLFRAFFAIPARLSTADGQPTNAVFGFAATLRKLLAGRAPDRIAVVFDPSGPTFRAEQFAAYKAHRPGMPPELRGQIPLVERLCAAWRLPVFRIPGFEADDVIGTLTARARAGGHEVRIVSGDKDFAQLVAPDVRVWDAVNEVAWDEDFVRQKWGVLPSQFVDLLALMGDASDGIPGVAGIGAKGAAGLLQAYGSLDGIYAHLEDISGKRGAALAAGRESAYVSRALATIACAVPLALDDEALRYPGPDLAAIERLYQELAFWSLLPKREASAAADAPVATAADLADHLAGLGEGPVAVWPVIEDPGPLSGALVGVALAGATEVYVPAAAFGALDAWFAEDRPRVVHGLRDWLTAWRRRGGAGAGRWLDVQLASFLLDPTGWIPHRFDQVVKAFLHRAEDDDAGVRGKGVGRKSWMEVPDDEAGAWACARARTLRELGPVVSDALDQADQRRVHDEVDVPLSSVLADMQLAGIRVDADVLAGLQVEFSARRDAVEADVIAAVGRPFNLGSPKQLGEVLFEELKLPAGKRTKTGWSTDADVLEKLAKDHAVPRLVLEHRALAKLVNTYTQVLRDAVSPQTGRVHCTIQQTVGASGRLITTDPDLQRTPIRTADGARIRRAFVAPPGTVIISADWSQIELRLLAHVTGDPLLVDSFRSGVDVHRRTAAEIFGVAPDQVTSVQRNIGKTFNFATIYGQGATALGQSLGLPRAEAKRMIERYFSAYAGVRDWADRTVTRAIADGFVTTLGGRRRLVPELASQNPTDRAYGERIAVNTPIQGSAADLCKEAMLRIASDLRGYRTRMLLQIHDELLFEAPPDEVAAVMALVRAQMEGCWALSVPLVVDVGAGESWAAAKG